MALKKNRRMASEDVVVKSLEDTTFEEIYEAFNNAFSDYTEPFNKTLPELSYMVERRGYQPKLSFGAFSKGALVSFVLNGVGTWHDQPTAYDTGTGTIKEFRHQGLGTRILEKSIPILRESGIQQYLLEVIRINTPACKLYMGANFEVTREFDYYVASTSDIIIDKSKLRSCYRVVALEGPDWVVFKSFWDFEPSWQNSIDSVTRKLSHFTFIGVSMEDDKEGNILAYAILEAETGDVAQFAVSKEHRRRGLGMILLDHLIRITTIPSIKFINLERTYLPFKNFLEKCSIKPGHGQFEMIRRM